MLLAFCIVMVVASLAMHWLVPPFIPAGEELAVTGTGFSQATMRHIARPPDEIRIEENGITLVARDPASNTEVFWDLDRPVACHYLLLEAEARGRNIVAGIKGWHHGRIVLVQYWDDKPHYNLPHQLFGNSGNWEWQKFAKVFEIDPQTEKLRLGLQMNRSSGELHLRNIHLHRAIANPYIAPVRTLVWSGWGLFLISLCWRGVHQYLRSPWFVAAVGLLMGTILLAIVLPGSMRSELSHEVDYGISQLGAIAGFHSNGEQQGEEQKRSSGYLPTDIDFFKAGHFTLFFLLAVLLSRKSGDGSGLQIVVGLLMLAVATECIQLFIPGRGGSVVDVGIDMAGVVVGQTVGAISMVKGDQS